MKVSLTQHAMVLLCAGWLFGAVGCDQVASSSAAPQASRPTEETKPTDQATTAATAQTLDQSFDDIKFEMEIGTPFKRSMLRPEIEALVGRRIRIRGYILPSFLQKGITSFVLVRDNLECCFGPGAALFDCIVVDMDDGKTVDYTVRPIAVTGTFDVREVLGPDGKHLAIYHLQASEAR